MDYARISRIEKAKIYAEEYKDRIDFLSLTASVRGDNNGIHMVNYNNGIWTCDCEFFRSRHEACSHIMALERVLNNMVEIARQD